MQKIILTNKNIDTEIKKAKKELINIKHDIEDCCNCKKPAFYWYEGYKFCYDCINKELIS